QKLAESFRDFGEFRAGHVAIEQHAAVFRVRLADQPLSKKETRGLKSGKYPHNFAAAQECEIPWNITVSALYTPVGKQVAETRLRMILNVRVPSLGIGKIRDNFHWGLILYQTVFRLEARMRPSRMIIGRRNGQPEPQRCGLACPETSKRETWRMASTI